ncbi:MAG: protein kinase [Polyangiaceae bacterium]
MGREGPRASAFPRPRLSATSSFVFGEGGMGRVFANDPRLHREVAIKLVRGDDPELTRRLIAEARAQARIDDERVCKVFEVGEVDGHVYIAMQYIAGQTLGAMAPDLGPDELAMILRDAARGAHEAHRAGIIHRDLKPSNILLERGDDGSLRTFVLDFGLARSNPDGTSVTAAGIGTPHYMSPEQARGDARLDRRADVYSLGATLYHVLCGEPPIPGSNLLDVLHNVATVEPRPLRAVAPTIPADLAAIAHKCLEKDPSSRYASARALADDLDCFLNGDPVTARPVTWLSRTRRWIGKNRRLTATLTAAALAVLIALGWGIRTRRRAVQREEQARKFAGAAAEVEALSLYSNLSRLHDVRKDRARIRERMDALATEMTAAGPDAEGPGHLALGRAALALGNDEEARAHLESAYKAGIRSPQAAFSLAVVLGNQYQSARLAAARLRDKAQRDSRLRAAEQRFRDPAIAHLREAEGEGAPSPRYIEALLASYEGRLDDALHLLDAMDSAPPWFYEAPKLRGDILSLRALERWSSGDKAGARSDFESGRAAFARATAAAESSPAVWLASANLEYGVILMEAYGEGEIESAVQRGLAAVKKALEADPEHHEALLLAARLLRRQVEEKASRGIVDEPTLREAVSLCDRAIALAPDRSDGPRALAILHWQWAQSLSQAGRDPTSHLAESIRLFERVPEPDRDSDYHESVGLTFDTWADHLEQSGGDPLPNRGRAIAAYRASVALPDGASSTWINLGNVYLLRAGHPRCEDPDGDLAEAERTLTGALEKNPQHAVARFYLAEALSLKAQRANAHGADARPLWDRAVSEYERALAINPGHAFFHNGLGNARAEQASQAWDRGEDPSPMLSRARAAFEQVEKLAPDLPLGPANVADVAVQRLEYALLRGEDPEPLAGATRAAVESRQELARRRDPRQPGQARCPALPAAPGSMARIPRGTLARRSRRCERR